MERFSTVFSAEIPQPCVNTMRGCRGVVFQWAIPVQTLAILQNYLWRITCHKMRPYLYKLVRNLPERKTLAYYGASRGANR